MSGMALDLLQFTHVFQSSLDVFFSSRSFFQHKKVMAVFLFLDTKPSSAVNAYFLDVSSLADKRLRYRN